MNTVHKILDGLYILGGLGVGVWGMLILLDVVAVPDPRLVAGAAFIAFGDMMVRNFLELRRGTNK